MTFSLLSQKALMALNQVSYLARMTSNTNCTSVFGRISTY